MLKLRRDVTRTAAGRLASSEAAAPLVTKITVFLKVNLLFALVGNVWFYCDRAVSPVTQVEKATPWQEPLPWFPLREDSSIWLDFSFHIVQVVTRQALTSFLTFHTIHSSQKLLEPTALAQTHRRASSLMAEARPSTPAVPGWQCCLACQEEGPQLLYKLITVCKILDQHDSKIFYLINGFCSE